MEKWTKIIKNKERFIFVVILLISIIFRFYNLVSWTSFGMDQEYQAYIARNIVIGHHFPLIGVNASDTGLYLGPLFSYFTAVTYFLFRGDPVIWSLIASCIGVLTSFLLYYVGKQMFSRLVGFMASFIYAGSFLISFYDRQYWNPSPIPLFSILIGYFIYRLLKKPPGNLIWVTILFSLAVQCHLSILIFLPIIFFSILKVRRSTPVKDYLWSVIILLVGASPIILFDLRHNFVNLKAFLYLFTSAHSSINISMLFGKIYSFLSIISRVLWVPFFPDLSIESGQCKEMASFIKSGSLVGVIVIGVATIMYLYGYRKKFYRGSNHFVLLSIILLTLIYCLLYPRESYEYYLLYFFPWLAVFVSLGLYVFFKKREEWAGLWFLGIFFIILNLGTLFTAKKSFSYSDKLNLISELSPYVEKEYHLEAIGGCQRFGGYRYLFDKFLRTPSSSYMDPYFSWLYSEKNYTSQVEKTILISVIDQGIEPALISFYAEQKINYLNRFTILKKSQSGMIQGYVLSRNHE